MKIQKLTLKEVEVIEVDGEFEKRFINAKTYPIFLTNWALKKGFEEGLLESSLVSSLAKLMPYMQSENKEGMLEHLDEQNMIRVIYLAFIGANRKVEMSYDEFLDKYHLDFIETTTLYVKLISDTISKENSFAKSLEQSTKKEKKSLSHRD